MGGVLIGSYVFGEASDRFGRKPTLIVSVILQTLFGLVSGVLPGKTFTIIKLAEGYLKSYLIFDRLLVLCSFENGCRNDHIWDIFGVLCSCHGNGWSEVSRYSWNTLPILFYIRILFDGTSCLLPQ